MRKRIKSLYLGVISGFIVSLVLSYSLWLDMRINTALALPALLLAAVGAAVFMKKEIPSSVIVVAQGGAAGVFVYMFGMDASAWTVVPAALVREGFCLEFLSFSLMNKMLAGLFILGNAALIPKKL